MDRLGHLVTGVPPVTRYWFLLIVASATATSLGWCSSSTLHFVPTKAFSTQPWRLVSSFCHFDGLSFVLLVQLYYMMGSALDLESKFCTPLALFPPARLAALSPSKQKTLKHVTEAYATADYLHYLMSISALIVALVTLGYYKLGLNVRELSGVLDSVIWYIWCRQHPSSPVVIFGIFSIPGAYVPWCLTVFHGITQVDYAHQIYSVMLVDAATIRLAVYMPFLWSEFVNYTIGHLWWFTRDFLITRVYYDSNESRRKIASSPARQAQREYVGRHPLNTSDLLRLVLLPPWYWAILRRVEAMPESEEADGDDENGNDRVHNDDAPNQHDMHVQNEPHNNVDDVNVETVHQREHQPHGEHQNGLEDMAPIVA